MKTISEAPSQLCLTEGEQLHHSNLGTRLKTSQAHHMPGIYIQSPFAHDEAYWFHILFFKPKAAYSLPVSMLTAKECMHI